MALDPQVPISVVDRADASETSEPERAVLERFEVEKRRLDWLLGRSAAKAAVRAAIGDRAPPTLAILDDENGAPAAFAVEGSALRPLDVALSLSPCHGLGVAVASERDLVGVDVERVRPRPEPTFRFYLHEDERAPLAALGEGPARDEAAIVLWALKEAAWKALRPARGT